MALQLHRMMAFAVLVSAATGIRAQERLSDHTPAYQSLREAILDGKSISVTFDLAACRVHGSTQPGPAIQGALHFEGYMIEADQTIAFSTTHFTVKADNTPVQENLSFRVLPSGTVTERSRFLDAKTYQLVHDATFDCTLGHGATFHW